MHHVIGQFNLMGMSGAPCKRHLRIEIKILAKKKSISIEHLQKQIVEIMKTNSKFKT